MAGESKITFDHDEIKKWVEERGGKPARVKNTSNGKDPGLLRINFPDYGAENTLQEISWEEFFQKFDEKQLAFLYQEQKASGQISRFFKFIARPKTTENYERTTKNRDD